MSNIIFTPDNADGRNRLKLFPGISKLSGEIFIKSLDKREKFAIIKVHPIKITASAAQMK